MSDQVVGQVEHTKLTEMVDIFNFRDFVGMQVQNIKFGKVLEISNSFDIVLTKHKHS